MIRQLPVPPYDPEGAEEIARRGRLARRVRVTINGPNDRLVNDAQIVQAVARC